MEPHLFQALEAVQTRLAADLLAELAPPTLALWPRRLRIVQFVPAEGIRQTDLAARAMITKQALGEHLDALCAGGVLRRVTDPDDGRAWRVELTDVGRAVVRDLNEALARVERRLRAEVGPEAYAGFRAVLETLGAARET